MIETVHIKYMLPSASGGKALTYTGVPITDDAYYSLTYQQLIWWESTHLNSIVVSWSPTNLARGGAPRVPQIKFMSYEVHILSIAIRTQIAAPEIGFFTSYRTATSGESTPTSNFYSGTYMTHTLAHLVRNFPWNSLVASQFNTPTHLMREHQFKFYIHSSVQLTNSGEKLWVCFHQMYWWLWHHYIDYTVHLPIWEVIHG